MLTTLDALKAEFGITDTSLDTLLTRYIKEASARIEGYVRQPLGERTITQTVRKPDGPIILEPDGAMIDTISLTSVTVDGTALDAADYERDGALLYPLSDDERVTWGADKVTVVYTAGYVLPSEASPTLPADVERACIELVRDSYNGRDRDPYLKSESYSDGTSASYGTMGVAPAVLETLAPYRKWVIA